MNIFSAQKGIADATQRLLFEVERVRYLRNSVEDAANGGALISPAAPESLDRELRNVTGIMEKVHSRLQSLHPKERDQRTQGMVRSVKYSFQKKEIDREINHLRQSNDSLYLTYELPRKFDDLYVTLAEFRGQTQTSRRLHASRLWADRSRRSIGSFRTERNFLETVTENSSVGDIWTGPIIKRLYATSMEGLEWIRKILDSTEIAGLIEQLQVWGTGLVEGPLRLDWLMGDDEDSCIYFLTGCFARICLNIGLLPFLARRSIRADTLQEIICITLESRDTDVLSYLKKLSLLLKGGDKRVTIPIVILAKIDLDANLTSEEKLLKYFNNIEDDLDLLYEMLPAIYIARHLYYLELYRTRNLTRYAHQ